MKREITGKFKVAVITGISVLVLGAGAVTAFAATDWFQPTVSYSIDGGETWNDASENDDIEVNIGEYNGEQMIEVRSVVEDGDLEGGEMIIEVNMDVDTD